VRTRHGTREGFQHLLALPVLRQRLWAAQSWPFFQLEQLLTRAGFSEVHTEPMMLIAEWASVDEYIRFQQAVLTGLNALLAKFPAEQQAEVWRAIAEAARQSTTPDGRCRTENEVVLAVGQR
jgi:hypothetical protein